MRVERLRVDYLTNPVGIDDRTPALSWRLSAEGGGKRQTAYQLSITSAGEVVWYTTKIASSQSIGVPYDGPALRSRQRLSWSVRAWDENDRATPWAQLANWEMGLLDRSDWTARWITDPAVVPRPQEPLVIRFPARPVRYLRLDVTRLGSPLREGWPDPVSRLQLAELQVYGGGTLLSHGRPATASEVYSAPDQWAPEFLTDGTLHSDSDPRGYTSFERHQQDLDESIWVEIDLGAQVDADEVRLYPRTDTLTPERRIANFPENYTIQVRTSADAPWTAVHTATGQQAPAPWLPPSGLPLLARTFTVDKPVERARLYAVGLGVCEFRLNGQKVGDAVLEPAYTDYRERVLYTTYDVTSAVRGGQNVLGAELGHGIYDVRAGTGRYTKFTGSHGPLKVLAQLEITHLDGTTSVVATDGSWRAESGPTTFTNWFGGEDYDSRRELTGWDQPGADHSAWRAATDLGAPTEDQVLTAQEAPPVRVTETVSAAMGGQVTTGVWLYDLGRNVAGWPEVTVRGGAGRTVRLLPGEKLARGRVTQADVGEPVYFLFTPKAAMETWHPKFMYYGFRYVEITGAASPPALADVRARVLRADNAPAGRIRTSDATLNAVYQLVERAVASNMFSVLTDCPHREKLGWLEEYHLLFDTVAANFDVAAMYRKLSRDIRDAQLPDGMVPDIAPEFTVFEAGFRDDPNWGGALIMVPFKHFLVHGDPAPLREGYPAMSRYMDYLASRAEGHVLDYGLGDWGAFDDSTPEAIAATSAYFRYATTMARIAEELGQVDHAVGYQALAGEIHTAFNAAFYDEETGSYGSGSQASNALPLSVGLVPDDRREPALAALKADIESRDDHLSTGEIGLRALFDVLGETGDVDLALRMALNPTAPSYVAMLGSGATTLPEFWDGRGSQNHFMMGAIHDWSYRYLAGIRPVEPGFRKFLVAPRLPASLDEVSAVWESPYGRIQSAWRRTGQGGVRMALAVPVNTEADVHVPPGGETVRVNDRPTQDRLVTLSAGEHVIETS